EAAGECAGIGNQRVGARGIKTADRVNGEGVGAGEHEVPADYERIADVEGRRHFPGKVAASEGQVVRDDNCAGDVGRGRGDFRAGRNGERTNDGATTEQCAARGDGQVAKGGAVEV